MKSRVVFADRKLKDAFDKLKDSRTEDKRLYEWLNRAFDDLSEDAVSLPHHRIQIQLSHPHCQPSSFSPLLQKRFP